MAMTPETREELARAMSVADGHEVVAAIDPNRPDDDFQPPQITDAGALSMYAGLADAIAPIIERLVAERVAAETERCAGIVGRLKAQSVRTQKKSATDAPWIAKAAAIEEGALSCAIAAIRSATR